MEKFNQSTAKDSNIESEKKINLPTWLKTAIISLGIIASQPVFSQINERIDNHDYETNLLNEISDFYRTILSDPKTKLELLKQEKKDSNTSSYEEIANNPKKFYENIVKVTESIRDEIRNHFSSEDFLEKLKEKFNDKKAKEKQAEIINNLDSVKVNIVSPDSIYAVTNGAIACYFPESHSILIPYFKFYYEMILHELLHGAYRGESELENDDISFLLKHFTNEKLFDQYHLDLSRIKEITDYLYNPGERMVRKKILDMEMERKGIKKYNEKFTEEHYKKLKELYDKKGLSDGAMDLMEVCTPEQLQNIMNTIAFEDAENLSKFKNIS